MRQSLFKFLLNFNVTVCSWNYTSLPEKICILKTHRR